jgi:hypothetical protein
MAHKRFLKPDFTFFALTFIITLIMLACSDPTNSEPLSEKYTCVKGSKTYELTITQNAANAQAKAKLFTRSAFTPAQGDSYVLKITENGAAQTSSGTVKAFSNNKFILTASINVSVSFEVTINSSGITKITGTITTESGATIIGPGEITPTSNTGGNDKGGNDNTGGNDKGGNDKGGNDNTGGNDSWDWGNGSPPWLFPNRVYSLPRVKP